MPIKELIPGGSQFSLSKQSLVICSSSLAMRPNEMSPLLSCHDYWYCYFSSHVYVFISKKECFTVNFLVFFFLQCTPFSLFPEPQNRSSVWVHPLGLHYSWPLFSTLCIVEDFCHGLHVLSGEASLMRGSSYNSLVSVCILYHICSSEDSKPESSGEIVYLALVSLGGLPPLTWFPYHPLLYRFELA